MKSTDLLSVALAAIAVSIMPGCGGMEGGLDDIDVEKQVTADDKEYSANPPFCRNGMRTKLAKMDQPWALQTCKLSQLPDLEEYICKTDPTVCAFLGVLEAHGRIQCTPYVNDDGDKKFCADVVERYPDGTAIQETKTGGNMNFFILSVDDEHAPNSPEVAYWNAQLANPASTAAPVSLQHVAFMSHKMDVLKPPASPSLDYAWLRMLTFDPRECSSCGDYDGPNMASIEYPDDLDDGWFPEFTENNCRFEARNPAAPGGQAFVVLPQAKCNDEKVYRDTAR